MQIGTPRGVPALLQTPSANRERRHRRSRRSNSARGRRGPSSRSAIVSTCRAPRRDAATGWWSTSSSSTATARGSPRGSSTSSDDRRRRVADRRSGAAVGASTTCTGSRSTRSSSSRRATSRSRAEDLELTLIEGSVFTRRHRSGRHRPGAASGRGEMRFSPTPDTEKGQVRIFAGAETLESRFDAAYIRVGDVERARRPVRARGAAGRSARPAARRSRSSARSRPSRSSSSWATCRATRGRCCPPAATSSPKSRTRRFDTLTYARSRSEAEDISLFDRRRQRNIAVYASVEKLAVARPVLRRGRARAVRRPRLRHRPDGAARAAVARGPGHDAAARSRIGAGGPDHHAAGRLARRPLGRERSSSGGCSACARRARTRCSSTCRRRVMRDEELTLTIGYGGRLAPQAPDRETLLVEQGAQTAGRRGRAAGSTRRCGWTAR